MSVSRKQGRNNMTKVWMKWDDDNNGNENQEEEEGEKNTTVVKTKWNESNDGDEHKYF